MPLSARERASLPESAEILSRRKTADGRLLTLVFDKARRKHHNNSTVIVSNRALPKPDELIWLPRWAANKVFLEVGT
jgi:hypothetical protein